MRSSSARTGEEDNENSVPVEGRAGRPDLLKEVMAVPEGFEPSTSRLEGHCSTSPTACKLSHSSSRFRRYAIAMQLATPARLERATFRLEGGCSIQLS